MAQPDSTMQEVIGPGPGKSRGRAVGFLLLYLLFGSVAALSSMVVAGQRINDLDNESMSAQQRTSYARNWLIGQAVTGGINYVVPLLVGGVFLIGRKYRSWRAFWKIGMITAMILAAISTVNLGQRAESRNPTSEQRTNQGVRPQ
ncbi:MAG: hypothetical protein K1X70_20745 [Leptospirales bacterium]|nr:hypothetical protein [Leptospirales bacterium]